MVWTTRSVALGDTEIAVMEAGTGRPLLILHDELGPPEWQRWHEALAGSRKLILPIVPGFKGERFSWLRSVTDLSRLWGRLLRTLALGPLDTIGFSFGGWLAAEMAINDTALLKRMLLVAPFGLKPNEGYIADMFIMSSGEYIRAGFADTDQTPEFAALYTKPDAAKVETWEDGRIESARLAWQPYMHHPAMPELAAGIATPTEIVWGEEDAIVPESAMRAYAAAISGSKLTVLKACGHRPELEQTDAFLKRVTTFLD